MNDRLQDLWDEWSERFERMWGHHDDQLLAALVMAVITGAIALLFAWLQESVHPTRRLAT